MMSDERTESHGQQVGGSAAKLLQARVTELEDLVERAVRNAKPRRARVLVQRWIAVKETFAVGRNMAEDLCHRYGIDPDEMVPRIGELRETRAGEGD